MTASAFSIGGMSATRPGVARGRSQFADGRIASIQIGIEAAAHTDVVLPASAASAVEEVGELSSASMDTLAGKSRTENGEPSDILIDLFRQRDLLIGAIADMYDVTDTAQEAHRRALDGPLRIINRRIRELIAGLKSVDAGNIERP